MARPALSVIQQLNGGGHATDYPCGIELVTYHTYDTVKYSKNEILVSYVYQTDARNDSPYVSFYTPNSNYSSTTYGFHGPVYFGIPDVSSSSQYYEDNFYCADFRGSWFIKYGLVRQQVPDYFAVGMDTKGCLVDSNVSTRNEVVVYNSTSGATFLASAALPSTSTPLMSDTINNPLSASLSVVDAPAVVIGSKLHIANNSLHAPAPEDVTNGLVASLPKGAAQATVQLNHIIANGEENLLLLENPKDYPHIHAASSTDGKLVLQANGEASLAEWEAALRSVTYQNTAANPSTGVRTVTFDFNDGNHVSYSSPQDYVVVTGSGPSNLLRTALEPNDHNFDGWKIAFDTGVGQNAGQAYRLYGAFDRAPDTPGLGYWIKALDDGASAKSVAQAFINSAEFNAVNGDNLTNTQFVAKLYEHILQHTPDQTGQAYWLNALQNGASRTDVLLGISESAENLAQSAPATAMGVVYESNGLWW